LSDKTGGSLIEIAQKLKELGCPTKKEIQKELFKTTETEEKSPEELAKPSKITYQNADGHE
jgi:hypothetical protein